jgi:hypothetical protein
MSPPRSEGKVELAKVYHVIPILLASPCSMDDLQERNPIQLANGGV